MKSPTKPALQIIAEQAQPQSQENLPTAKLDCTIAKAHIVFLMGLDHTLSSSYMNMLAGLQPPQSGRVTLLGEDSRQITQQQQSTLRRRVGFVLPGGPLLSVLNGFENLTLAARYHRIGDEETIQQKAQQLLSALPSDGDYHQLPAYMNKLQQRLIAIARPLMLDPEVLFVDHPFQGLGLQDRNIVAKYLANIAKHDQVTLVIGSDDLYFAHSMAQQIIFCDSDEARSFNGWDSFFQHKQEAIQQLSDYEQI